ncbi:hypothetical protein SEA_AFLAC_53 [Gordonia phage Aflac]|nr:hypothetical protein SEA_JODELIE19_53 [Gordonia phage Jodelie19]QWY82385.1 hypothetical protein SEA_AFLAC_53 [Gordonia phage Aflac]QXO13059.1 hypothetical protein SEA_FIGLIAR_52 [Gordonia phage Figliar]WNT45130.1 hypothetical protein SEA_OLGASCLOVER_55 [Gordonia phage OlgasClover]
MESAVFNQLVEDTLAEVKQILVAKGVEYVPGGEEQDRFHNFEISAAFNQQRSTEALWGFLTKHLVSLSDMVKVDSTDHTMAKWDEKIHDAIIYLILLKGIVTENDDKMEQLKSQAVNISTEAIDGDIHIHTTPPPSGLAARMQAEVRNRSEN